MSNKGCAGGVKGGGTDSGTAGTTIVACAELGEGGGVLAEAVGGIGGRERGGGGGENKKKMEMRELVFSLVGLGLVCRWSCAAPVID